MPSFYYRAVTAQGVLETGSAEAADLEQLIALLSSRQLRPVAAQPDSKSSRKAPGRLPRRLVPKIFGELAVLLDAGMPLDRALALMIEDAETPRLRDVLEELLAQIRQGATLSSALERNPSAFPPMAPAMAAAGEANGRSAEALKRLSNALERAESLRSSLVSAAIYPLLLVLIAAGVIALMLFWVVPQFETLFEDGRAHLPAMTRIVLAVSHFARTDGLITLGALTLVVGLAWRLSFRPTARRWFDRKLLGAPRLGALVTMAELARFFRVLGSMVDGGVALPAAVTIAERSLTNTHIRAAVRKVAQGLREGEELTGPFSATGVIPKRVVSYLRTGEATAQLPMMLTRLADTLDTDVRMGVDRLVLVLTPVITVIMGALVATVVASIMSAIIGFDDLALNR